MAESIRTLRETLRGHAFAIALLAALLYLVGRSLGLYPMVFADEWYYSAGARLQPLADARLPSYLYLWLYGVTDRCGPGFLDCARVMNAVQVVAAAPFIYLIGRSFLPPAVAALLALCGILGPASVYAAYFMPESSYFLAFFVFAWVALAWRHARPLRYGLATGALLGVMAAIKVHALFLLPAQLAFMLYLAATLHRGHALRAVLQMALALVAATVVVRLALGYALAGDAGLGLLGSFYGTHAANSTGEGAFAAMLRILPDALASLRGHALAIALVAAFPLAVVALHLLDRRTREAAGEPLCAVLAFTLLMLGATVAMTVVFTASIATHGPFEGVRLHQRYYGFVFPLLLLVAASPLAAAAPAPRRARRAAIALAVAAALLFAVDALPAGYRIVFNDTPELSTLFDQPRALRLYVAAMLVLLALFAVRARLAAQAFVFIVVPLSVVGADVRMRAAFDGARQANVYDTAALVAHHYLGPQQVHDVAVVGEGAGLLRALFHLDSPHASFIDVKPGTAWRIADLRAATRWVLVVGDYQVPAQAQVAIDGDGFVLARLPLPDESGGRSRPAPCRCRWPCSPARRWHWPAWRWAPPGHRCCCSRCWSISPPRWATRCT